MLEESPKNQRHVRTIIIGDVHGCLDELKTILKKLVYNPQSDRLILTGDLISKGPYPFETLKFCRDLNVEIVMGNHEHAFLLYLQGKKQPYSTFSTLKQKMLPELKKWQCWFEKLPLFIETPEFIVVHAGLHPSLPLAQTPPSVLTTIRTWGGEGKPACLQNDPPWFNLYKGKKLVVFGHWAKQGLIIRDNVIGLDSGCVYGKYLSALILPQREIVQVKAAQIYQHIS